MENTEPHLVAMVTDSAGKSTDKAKRTSASARNTSHRHPLPTFVFLVRQQKTPAVSMTLGWSLGSLSSLLRALATGLVSEYQVFDRSGI